MVVNKILLAKVKVRFSVLLSELLGDTIEIKLHCQHIHQAFVCDKPWIDSATCHKRTGAYSIQQISSRKKHDTSYDRDSG